jgi:di/tricarboxylate transporter
VTREIALTLGVTAAALALFIWNRLRVDVVGLLVMAALILLGLVTPRDAISGFANEATVTVALMLALSTGLLRTGAVDVLGQWVSRLAGTSEVRVIAVVLGVVLPLSAFINNTAAVAILMPIVLGVSRTAGVAPSRTLMPLSFGSQLGGTLTLIGTSTNLLVAGLVLDAGLGRIGLFDVTPAAAVLVAIGALYLLTVGRWLSPVRAARQTPVESYELREYLTALVVGAESNLVGRTLAGSRFGHSLGLQVVQIQRGDQRIVAPNGATTVHAGDVLVVTGKITDIAQIEDTNHLEIAGAKPDLDASARSGGESQWAEVLVNLGSEAAGRTLTELGFRARHDVTALAIQRHGHPMHGPVGRVPLAQGDILLVQGTPRALRELHEGGDFGVLGSVRVPAKRRRKALRATLIMVAVVLLPAFGVTTILVSALLGMLAMILTGCTTPDEVYQEMDWSVLVLLAAILPLGLAMRNSGTADWLAAQLLDVTRPLGAHGTLAAFYALTTVLTAIISNNAAAVVAIPVAIAAAGTLGISPMPLIVAVMLAASTDFSTPIGYQTNTFIYGPGGYRFVDFLRVGGPLNVLLLVTAPIVIPIFFPF